MLDIRKPCMVMTNPICLKLLNSSRNKDMSTNFKFPIWKCLPNTLWSFRLSTRLGKVSRILFEKGADHRILTMPAELCSEFWSHWQFFTEYAVVVQAFNNFVFLKIARSMVKIAEEVASTKNLKKNGWKL